jgi:hypothetical protein
MTMRTAGENLRFVEGNSRSSVDHTVDFVYQDLSFSASSGAFAEQLFPSGREESENSPIANGRNKRPWSPVAGVQYSLKI